MTVFKGLKKLQWLMQFFVATDPIWPILTFLSPNQYPSPSKVSYPEKLQETAYETTNRMNKSSLMFLSCRDFNLSSNCHILIVWPSDERVRRHREDIVLELCRFPLQLDAMRLMVWL